MTDNIALLDELTSLPTLRPNPAVSEPGPRPTLGELQQANSKVSNLDTADRLRGRLRSARFWTCRQPEPPRRQSHWCERLGRGDRGEAAGAAARVGPHGDNNCFTRQPDHSRCRNCNERGAGSGPRPRAATPCPACEQRPRFRCSLCNGSPTAGRRARDRRRSIFHEPQSTARQADGRSRGAYDLRVPRVRCGRRPHKLRNWHRRRIPSGWRLHRPHPQRRCSGRRKSS
jgi:hypothetical protein